MLDEKELTKLVSRCRAVPLTQNGYVATDFVVALLETVKPDVHILRFVAGAIGRPVNELEAVEALEEVAKRLGLSPRTLDWSIWEYQRALVGRR